MLAERVKRMEKMQTSESTSNWSCVSIRLTSLIDANSFGDGPTPLSTRPPGKRELLALKAVESNKHFLNYDSQPAKQLVVDMFFRR
jgi:hypothetical protein